MLKWTEKDEPNIKRWGQNAKLYDSHCGKFRVRYFDCFEGISRRPTYTIILMNNGLEQSVLDNRRAWSGVLQVCREYNNKPVVVKDNTPVRNRRTANRGVKLCSTK